MKRCYKCGETKDLSFFYKNKSKKDGLTDECKECINKRSALILKKKIAENPNYYKEWYERSKESIKKSHAKYADKIRNRRKITGKKYYRENREKILKKSKEYNLDEENKLKRWEWRQNTKDRDRLKNKDFQLKKNYGISIDDYNQMALIQERKCKICGKEPKKLYVDHCHKTKKVRGLLCRLCNLGLGIFNDDIELLKSAILYLNI